MVQAIQLVGIFFSLFMLYYTFLHFKRKEFTVKEFGIWLILWLLFIIFTINPEILKPLVKNLNLARTMDFFIITGFIFLVGITTYTYTIVRKTQNRIEEVVTKLAIKDAEERERKE